MGIVLLYGQAVFLWLYLVFISNTKYSKPYGYAIFGALVLLLLYVTFGNTIFDEYGGSLPEIAIIFIAIKTLLFGLMLFLPQYRLRIRYWLFSMVIFLYVLLLIQNTISEYFFWNEFGVRYNFIAVNYLVYTNEVIGNIMESYPVIPIFSALFIIAGLITYYIVKKSKLLYWAQYMHIIFYLKKKKSYTNVHQLFFWFYINLGSSTFLFFLVFINFFMQKFVYF